MIPQSCVLIETKKFPILDGERDEIINENMYGKSLCIYLEKNLPKAGIRVPYFCAEDWGWWLEVECNGFEMGLCIYSDPDAKVDPEKYAIIPSIQSNTKWSWSKFRKIDISKNVLNIVNGLESVFSKDNEVFSISRHDTFPL